LIQLERLVDHMPRGDLVAGRTAAQKLVLRTLTGVRLAELDRLVRATPAQTGEASLRTGLDSTLAEIQDALASLSDALSAQYFHHEEQPHSLVGQGRTDLPKPRAGDAQ
jgi:uncharacterized alpha-E superfamily protein